MTQARLWSICAFVALGVLGCVSKTFDPAASEPFPAERIAFFGHGKLFDAAMNEIRLDDALLVRMQDSMLDEIEQFKGRDPGRDDLAAVAQAQQLLKSPALSANEAVLLRSGVIHTLLKNAPRELRDKYEWRNTAIFYRYWNQDLKIRVVSERIRELLKNLHLFDPANQGTPTAYMDDCRAHGVPVPPDWAETGSAWRKQGTLSTNLLSPGAYAEVWTYSDPAQRGACVALPRDSGAPGTLAGIICQSATTGRACFWDNQLRSAPANVLGWKGQRLVIADLVDGATMADAKNCTGCHRGNNVYLMSPDDATWAKVLRGPLAGGSTGTFTTRVEASTDTRGMHPRYIPVTTVPERAGWTNTFSTGGCAGACHEPPVLTRSPAMPPACASPSTSSPASCYGAP
jgi:hypothetical protein